MPQSICSNCERRVIDALLLKRQTESSQMSLNRMRSQENVTILEDVVILKSPTNKDVYNISVPKTNDWDTVVTLRPVKDKNFDEDGLDDNFEIIHPQYDQNVISKILPVKHRTTDIEISSKSKENRFDIKDEPEDAVSFLLGETAKKNRKSETTNKHKCNVCTKSFLRKSNLVDHLRLHANVRQFECNLCHKKFVQKGNMLSHMRTHSTERPYECQICDKRYNQSSALSMHMRSLHTKERNFVCKTCPKAFSNVSDLRKHERIHDPTARIRCELCGRGFVQTVNLRQHMKRIHNKIVEKNKDIVKV